MHSCTHLEYVRQITQIENIMELHSCRQKCTRHLEKITNISHLTPTIPFDLTLLHHIMTNILSIRHHLTLHPTPTHHMTMHPTPFHSNPPHFPSNHTELQTTSYRTPTHPITSHSTHHTKSDVTPLYPPQPISSHSIAPHHIPPHSTPPHLTTGTAVHPSKSTHPDLSHSPPHHTNNQLVLIQTHLLIHS